MYVFERKDQFIDYTMAWVFAMNRHFSPKFIFAKVIFKNEQFITEVQVEAEDGQPVCCIQLDLIRVPGIACLLCDFLSQKHYGVICFYKDTATKSCSSKDMIDEKVPRCFLEVQLEDLLPN